MTLRDSPLAELTRALAARGFVFVGRDNLGRLSFTGTLTAEGASHSIRLVVHPEGRELPLVILDSVPDKLRPIAPHLGSNGGLCYAAAGSIALDVFDIAGQTLACIDRAAQILSKLLRGEMVADLEEEFFAYWRGDICFLDLRRSSNDKLECIVAKLGSSGRAAVFVTNDRTRTLAKMHAMDAQSDDDIQATVRRIRTKARPRPLLGDWPPRTVRDILHWQGHLDGPCRRKLDKHITDVLMSGRRWMLCVIESPTMPYAFWVDFTDSEVVKGIRRITEARKLAYRASITPVHCVRIDDAYIAQRNAPDQATLARRRIALVGCGTIGGFLAELLTKAGAGSDGGELALVDNDVLLPQNIGRHRLGFNSVLKNKATALAEEMLRSMPGTNIHALPVDAMQAHLAGFEMVVNATGEEALGHLLTRKYRGSQFVPMLTIWVEGPGVAVRALLRDSPLAACTRCLLSLDRQPLYPAIEGEMPVGLAGHGCESLYVPFPASASVQAACLGVNILTAWSGGSPTARLRTQVLDGHFCAATPDHDPVAITDCPACGT